MYAKMNFVIMFLGDDSVRGDESALISNHKSMVFISGRRSLIARHTHFHSPRAPFVPIADRPVRPPCGPPLGPDLRYARKYTVHHSTAGGSQGRVRALIHPLLEHHEEAVVQFLDAGGLSLPVCFQECAASRFQ